MKISFLLLIEAQLVLGQASFEDGAQLFPERNGRFFSDPDNPAYGAHSKNWRMSLKGTDRFLLPELAFQEFRTLFPLDKGSLHAIANHYGNRNFRRGGLSFGYSRPLGPKSEAGIRIGSAFVRIGDNHGQSFFWRGSFGFRSRLKNSVRWEVWVKDPHSILRKTPISDLHTPAITAAIGKKWPGPNSWTVELSKHIERKFRIRTRGRVGLHEDVELITSLRAFPLRPGFGWSWSGKRFFIRMNASWKARLGITPSCLILYRPFE